MTINNSDLTTHSDSSYYSTDRGYWISFENARIPADQQNIILFHGFITAFKDLFKPEWNEETVFGRTEPIGIYKGISRRLTFAFDAPAYSEKEGERNLNKVEGLVQLLYPSYHNLAKNRKEGEPEPTAKYRVLSQSPLVRIKFANLIGKGNQALLGYITSLDYDLNLGKDIGVFDHVSGKLYPRVINFNVDFTVLHEQELGFDDDSNTFLANNGWLYGLSDTTDTVEGGDKTYGQQKQKKDSPDPKAVQDEVARLQSLDVPSAARSIPTNIITDSVGQADADAFNAALKEEVAIEKKRLIRDTARTEIDKQKEALNERTTVKDLVKETKAGIQRMRINSAQRQINRTIERTKERDKKDVTFKKFLMSEELVGRE